MALQSCLLKKILHLHSFFIFCFTFLLKKILYITFSYITFWKFFTLLFLYYCFIFVFLCFVLKKNHFKIYVKNYNNDKNNRILNKIRIWSFLAAALSFLFMIFSSFTLILPNYIFLFFRFCFLFFLLNKNNFKIYLRYISNYNNVFNQSNFF